MSLNGIELRDHREQLEAARIERASHPAWNPVPTPEPNMADKNADAIGQYVTDYNNRVRAIEQDPALSDEGKAELLTSVYEDAVGKVGGMRAASAEMVDKRTNELTRDLFGMRGNTTESDYRDARARVVAVRDPEALCNLMDEAEALGDRTLLRAGFARAWEKSREEMTSPIWAGIVEEYTRTNPSTIGKVDELRNLLTVPGLTGQHMRKAQTTIRKPKGIR